VKSEQSYVTVLGLKDKTNEALEALYVMPRIDLSEKRGCGEYQIKSEADPWLRVGTKLRSLGELYDAVG